MLTTTGDVCVILKKKYKRIFRAPEVNVYAKQLGLKPQYNYGNIFYQWSKQDIENLLKLEIK